MASTIKVDTIDTPSGSGNITLNRPIAGDGSNLTGVYATDSLGATTHSKVIATTYDLSTASGNKDITGFGFDPKVIFMFYGTSGTDDWGWGFMNVTQDVGYCLRTTGGAVGLFDQSANLLTHQVTASDSQVGDLATLSDGVRIAFTKNGSPTGTLYIKVIGFK